MRVLHEGSPVHPPLDWIPLVAFIRLLEDLVPQDLAEACVHREL